MRWRGLAQSRDTFPPISQRPLRRSTTYQGQERSRCSSRDQITGWLGAPRAVAGAFSLPTSRGCPQAGWRRVLPQPMAQSFLLPIDRGFPQTKRLKFSLRRVAQSFLLVTQLRVSPPPHTSKFSLRRWPEVPPCGFPSCQVAPGFPETRGPRVCPIPGGPGFPPNRWRRTSPCPKARSCPLPGGSGFPLRRLPSLVVKKFLRLSARLHKRFWAAISRFFGRPQAIHS
jgi:hypothetical protein